MQARIQNLKTPEISERIVNDKKEKNVKRQTRRLPRLPHAS